MNHRRFKRSTQDPFDLGRGRGARVCLCIPGLLMLGAVALLGAIGCDGSDGSSAAAATSTSIAAVATSTAIAPATPTATPSPAPAFTICSNQTYALCAVASCFVLDDLAYCKCDVLSGDSISESDAFGEGQNICTVNAEGAENGYMASTFSLPDSVVAPDGDQALYNCPAATSTGAYAQCDGGLCFTSSQGQSFPGFSGPLIGGEIICSCPITLADPATARIGYQIAGPYPCQKSFFQNCKRATASKKNGSQIYVGAPTGVAALLTRQLNGSVPALNQCRP